MIAGQDCFSPSVSLVHGLVVQQATVHTYESSANAGGFLLCKLRNKKK